MSTPTSQQPSDLRATSAAFTLGAADPTLGRAVMWLGVLFLASIAVFVPSLPGGFLHWDDRLYVLDNALLLVASPRNILTAFAEPYFANYHPLTILSYMLDMQLVGRWAPWFRGVNVFLHGATMLALFGLLRQMGARWWVAWWATLMFAVHPLRVESVVWIAERKDVLCGLFYTLAVAAWARASTEGEERPRWLWLSLACVLLAFLAKAMAVSLPIVLILHDAFLARRRMRGRVVVYLCLVGVAVAFTLANLHAQRGAIAEHMRLVDRLGMACYSPFHYLVTTLWPVGLSPMYPREALPSARWSGLLAGVATCVAGLLALGWSMWHQPRLAWSLMSTVVCLGPVSGIVAVGGAYAADRYSYLPTVLLLAGVAPLASAAIERASATAQRVAVAVAGAVVAALMAATYAFIPHWLDDESMWRRAAAVYPQVPRLEVAALAHGLYRNPNRAAVNARVEQLWQADSRIMQLGELRLAMQTVSNADNTAGALEQADLNPERYLGLRHGLEIRLANDETEGLAERARELRALSDLIDYEDHALAALALTKAGHEDEARAVLGELRWPTFYGARAWGHLAKAARERGHNDEALRAARRSLEIMPGEANALRVAVEVLLDRSDLSGARRVARRAANHFASAPYARAMALIMLSNRLADGDAEQRREDERVARELIDEGDFSVEELVFLAFTAEGGRNAKWAGELYEAALAKDPQAVKALDGLAFVALSAGDLRRAEELFARILTINPDDRAAASNLARVRANLAASGS